MAGRVTTFVFDKTGTLTEDGLSVQGCRPSFEKFDQLKIYKHFTADLKELQSEDKWWEKSNYEWHRSLNQTLLLEALASCTAITYVNGGLIGDPLDVKMFEATGWTMFEPHTQMKKA
jgi:cation-transporting ATPase 13A2